MPPELGISYPQRWQGIPPHMSAQDRLLWDRARDAFAPHVLRWYFDVAVGAGADFSGQPFDDLVEQYRRLTRKRIDVVALLPDRWQLIECRPNAGLGALGAILSYRSLWDRDPPDPLPSEAWIISDRLEPDTLTTATNWGIRFFQV